VSEFQTKFIAVNRLNLAYVDEGQGETIIFCHGFPELWQSWRHQIGHLTSHGYRCIALDMRGHGRSDVPETITDYTVLHTVGDVIGLLDALGIERAVVVGHDAGTTTAYHAALMRPDRIRAVVGLSVPYLPRGPISLIEAMAGATPPGFYMRYFQEPAVAEADLEADVRETLRRIFFVNSGENAAGPTPMIVPPGGTLVGSLAQPHDAMQFLPDEVLETYVTAYERTGFTGGLNGYRVFQANWSLTAPWHGMALPVPSIFIGGSKDIVLGFPGFREAADAMDETRIIEGAGHWIQAERPDVVNTAIDDFIRNLSQR
jgi:pimeloyl-ACP methyl ester carboxylesterase